MFDNVIILAPEKNLNLYNIVKELENRNIKLLNCSSSFINIATNKISFYENIKNLPDNKINTYVDYNDINSQHPIIAKKIAIHIYNQQHEGGNKYSSGKGLYAYQRSTG